MWIKICGNTTLEDSCLALKCGADALGFVFAPSPRQVTENQARRIIAGLPAGAECYGVFVDAPLAEIVSAVSACGLTGVQLHRSSDGELPLRLREHFAGLGGRLTIVRVIDWKSVDWRSGDWRSGDGRPGITEAPERGGDFDRARFDRALDECGRDPAVDAVLIDSPTAKAGGGTGVSFDWKRARAGFLRAAPTLRMIVAGGLHPGNVGEAISTLRPWGVDVATGVEASPGKKDGARLAAFVQAARQAGRRADSEGVAFAGPPKPERVR